MVYDCDDGNVNYSKELGTAKVSLGTIAGARKQTVTLPLQYKEKQHGDITISAEIIGTKNFFTHKKRIERKGSVSICFISKPS